MTLKQFNEITREAKRTGETPTAIAMRRGFKRFDYSNHKHRRKAKAQQRIERKRALDTDLPSVRWDLLNQAPKQSVARMLRETSRHLAKMLYDRMVRP